MKEKYYITTAIAYTSKIPHIGNTYEWVLADAIARYKRKRGFDVRFLTGTDEHGQKIEGEAKKNSITPKEHVDFIAGKIIDIYDKLGVKYDDFIRTTDERHVKRVQKIFTKLYEQGDIYKGHYEGMYCVACESFFTDSQLVEGKCPDCGADVKKEKEEAYFFKLSKYQDELMEYINKHPNFIYPESRKNEMINNFLKPGLKDLCVSRSSFSWGIPVEVDKDHVVYVWLDALSNYITALGYNVESESEELFNKYWPADLHLIGKDIIRFHTIYWPIFLLALGVELPKMVYGHPWLLFGDGSKMSKSRGNTLYATELVDKYGRDRVRYSVLREIPFENDGRFDENTLILRTNTDLANSYGNLVNRTLAMNNKYFSGKVEKGEFLEVDKRIIDLYKETLDTYEKKMDSLHIAEAIEAVMSFVKASNKYIDETTPWLLAKDEESKERLKTVLYVLTENIRIATVLLEPFIPDSCEKVFNQIGTEKRCYESIKTYGMIEEGIVVGKGEPIFERLELVEVEEEEVETFKAEIEFSDWEKLDIRVAKITKVEKHKKADKLYVLTLEVGNSSRQVVSGIREYYTEDELLGKHVVLLANLKPIKLRGIKSEGMLLAEAKGEKVLLLEATLESGSEIG